MAVIVNFDAERDKQPDALDRLLNLVRDDMERVSADVVAAGTFTGRVRASTAR